MRYLNSTWTGHRTVRALPHPFEDGRPPHPPSGNEPPDDGGAIGLSTSPFRGFTVAIMTTASGGFGDGFVQAVRATGRGAATV